MPTHTVGKKEIETVIMMMIVGGWWYTGTRNGSKQGSEGIGNMRWLGKGRGSVSIRTYGVPGLRLGKG